MEFEKFEKKEFPIHWIIVAILTIVLVLQTIVFFIYSNYDGIDNTTLQEEYVKKSEVAFDMLNSAEKEKYVKKEEFNTLEDRYSKLKDTNTQLSKKVDEKSQCEKEKENLINNKTEIKENTKESKKDKEDDKVKTLEKENESLKAENTKLTKELKSLKTQPNKSKKPTFHSDDTNFYDVNGLKQIGYVSCKDMALGTYTVTKECRENVQNYLKDMPKDAIYEVVSMLSKDDKKIMTSNVNELALVGLGKFRVAEAKWLLTKYIGESVKIKLVSYDTNTNDSRGFVIKVYK